MRPRSWVNTDKRKEKIVQDFIKDANVLSITGTIVDRCVAIRRNKKIKTPDAIIAATAIVHGLILITSDEGFRNIQDLQIVDPFNLLLLK